MSSKWIIPLVAMALAVGACAKKEEPVVEAPKAEAPSGEPQMPASHPPMGSQEGQGGMMGMGAPAGPREVVVPEEVANTWKAVVLEVMDKETSATESVTIDVGQTATVSGLEITVTHFLPSFTMGGGAITSKSAETENPAALLSVKENGTEVFAGWLFSMYPEAHPFTHDKYSVLLKDFVKQ